MKLAKQRYIYPPRPADGGVPFADVNMYNYEGSSYVYQLKYNDKRTLFSVADNDVELWTRTQSKHTYHLTEELRDEILEACQILGLDTETWNYLDGGLLHGKNKILADKFVIWDIIVRDFNWLTGTTYEERYNSLLEKLDGELCILTVGGKDFEIGIKVTDNVMIARVFDDPQEAWDFVQEINEAAGWTEEGGGEPLFEGFVIKDESGKLKIATAEKNNDHWQARCRIKTGRHRQ